MHEPLPYDRQYRQRVTRWERDDIIAEMDRLEAESTKPAARAWLDEMQRRGVDIDKIRSPMCRADEWLKEIERRRRVCSQVLLDLDSLPLFPEFETRPAPIDRQTLARKQAVEEWTLNRNYVGAPTSLVERIDSESGLRWAVDAWLVHRHRRILRWETDTVRAYVRESIACARRSGWRGCVPECLRSQWQIAEGGAV